MEIHNDCKLLVKDDKSRELDVIETHSGSPGRVTCLIVMVAFSVRLIKLLQMRLGCVYLPSSS